MLDINVTLLIQIVNFLVFLTLMNIVLYRPIRRILAERQAHIDAQRAGIDEADGAAAKAVRDFEDGLREARMKGRYKVDELKEAGREFERDLLQKASDAAAEEVNRVKASVAKEIDAARAELQKQVKVFSTEMAQRILGRSL